MKTELPQSPPVPPQEGDQPRIDVRGMIRQASRRVRVDQLVKRGKKYISMLSKEKIDELINQAVHTILQKHRGEGGIKEEVLEAEAKQDFNELLSQYEEATKAKNSLAATHEGLVSELDDMRAELEQQKRIADGKMDEEAEHMLIIGFKEFERELDHSIRKMFDKRKMILENEEDPEAIRELNEIEARLRSVISKLVQVERQRFAGAHAKDRYVALLERRIGKMIEQMASMENALKMVSNQKVFSNQQIANLLRELGLAPEDEMFKKKKEMLKVVFDQNIQLRKDIRELRRGGGSAA